MKRIKNITKSLIATGMLSLMAQDVHFTNQMMFPLLYNPALSGLNADLNAVLAYRNQWRFISSPFKTIGASVDGRIHTSPKGHIFSGGLMLFTDNVSTVKLKTNQFALSFAYHLKLEKGSIGVGLYGGGLQRSIDFSQARWGNQYDGLDYNASLPSNEVVANNRFFAGDIGSGIVYTYSEQEKYEINDRYIGVKLGYGAFHLSRPNTDFLMNGSARIPIRHSVFSQVQFGIKGVPVLFEPMIIVNYQYPNAEPIYSLMGKYHLKTDKDLVIIGAGIFVRHEDALSPAFYFEMKNIGLGFNYDINTFGINKTIKSKGAMEFFLTYKMNKKLKNENLNSSF